MKKILALAACVALLVGIGSALYADDPFTARPHEWRNTQTFQDDVTFNDPVTMSDTVTISGAQTISGAVTMSSTLAVSGAATFTSTLTASDGLIQGVYLIPSTTTAYTHVTTNGNHLLVNKGTIASLTVTLPTITSALDGYIMFVKQIDTGTTATVLTPVAGSDTIECTRGTASATTCGTLDYQGDCMGFVADYTSGASGVWRQLWTNVT